MRALAVVMAWLAAFIVVAVVAFFGVLVLAGPHGGVLPDFTQPYLLVLAWLAVLLVPLWVACRVWRRMLRPRPDSD